MRQDFTAINHTLAGNPDGGTVHGLGLTINWQRGPLEVSHGEAPRANGCFVETVIEAARQRLEYYQGTRFQCLENSLALCRLDDALQQLQGRTRRRQGQGVEGTQSPDLIDHTPPVLHDNTNPTGPVG